ncbi:uncharacterized protein [Diadema antillarum]|uniref:uncharacterized protein n=1 Tax=Diadema antillarum TaxID=105358 RepID=UPI003A844160
MTVDFCDDTATTMLTVTCTILSADQPNPFVTMFYIYENVTDNPSPVSTASAFTRATPDFDTEYLCVSGNYLGNTTAARNFVPGSGACPCDCPSSGMIAAVSIMGVLLAVSVAVNIMQFYKQTTVSSQVPSTSEKQARTGLSGGNENSAYEMIESRSKGNAVYQPLTPSTVALEPENLTFFSRLGSIGLGKFGDVWKGELRTNREWLR